MQSECCIRAASEIDSIDSTCGLRCDLQIDWFLFSLHSSPPFTLFLEARCLTDRPSPDRHRSPKPPRPCPGIAEQHDPFACFHPVTAAWFRAVFDAPTAPQRMGWPAIARGENALILAPTGTGKTLAAFLWCLDRLMLHAVDRRQFGSAAIGDQALPTPSQGKGCRIVYVSPLKALAVDVERNLRSPLAGMANMARRMGVDVSRAGHQRAHRRHAAARARALCAASGRDSDHHAGVALPAAHLAGRRSAAHGRHGHHRRDSCAGAHQARRASGALAGAAGGADEAAACSASGSPPRSGRWKKWRGFSAEWRLPEPSERNRLDSAETGSCIVEADESDLTHAGLLVH